MKEKLSLKKLAELQKKNIFLKSGGILCKVNRFVREQHEKFGLRWLIRKLSIYPNAYYNHLKKRKAEIKSVIGALPLLR